MISTPSVFGNRCRSEDPVPARPDRLRRAHVVVLLQRQHLAAHDPRSREPARDRERDHHRPLVRGADDRQRDDRERQVREPVERVEEAHQAVVEAAADEAGDRPVDDADREDRERRAEGDQDRDPAAEGGAHEEVAAELVGAEEVREARVLVRDREVDGVRVVARDDRDDQAVEDDQDEDPGGDERAAVAPVAAPGVLPEVRLPDRRAARAERVLDDQPFVADVGGSRRHQVLASRVRGSRMP